MLLNGISALAHIHYGDPLLPPCDENDLEVYIRQLATEMGWLAKDCGEDERLFLLPEQEFVIATAQTLNRKLHAIYAWGQTRGDRYTGSYTRKNEANARTRDLDYILSAPDLNRRELAELKGTNVTTIKVCTGTLQKYLDVELIRYHHRQYYQGFWLYSHFTKNPIVQDMLKEIYRLGEETKEKAKVSQGEMEFGV